MLCRHFGFYKIAVKILLLNFKSAHTYSSLQNSNRNCHYLYLFKVELDPLLFQKTAEEQQSEEN